MIQVADNFNYRGKKPNFDRDSFDTLQDMKNYSENSLDDGHISYCKETWYDSNGNPAYAEKTGIQYQRPANVKMGFYYFDTSLNKPIWKNSDTKNVWIDATGATV